MIKHFRPARALMPLLLVLATLPAISLAALQVSLPFTGTWVDKDGGLIALDAQRDVIDLHGTDQASIYRGTCTVDPKDDNVATCLGDGYNHSEGFRFTYRNRIRAEGNATLIEDWEAVSRQGTIKGSAVFKRKSRQEPTPATR